MPEMTDRNFIMEPERRIPVSGTADVIVCGGGPAGVCAAVAAARLGAKTLLLEQGGALGGIMTSGLMSNIIDSEGKKGLLREMIRDLTALGAKGDRMVFDVETVKYYLERLCRFACIPLPPRCIVTVKRACGRLLRNPSPGGRHGAQRFSSTAPETETLRLLPGVPASSAVRKTAPFRQ